MGIIVTVSNIPDEIDGTNKSLLIITITIEKNKKVKELTKIELNPNKLLKNNKEIVPNKNKKTKNNTLLFSCWIFFSTKNASYIETAMPATKKPNKKSSTETVRLPNIDSGCQ